MCNKTRVCLLLFAKLLLVSAEDPDDELVALIILQEAMNTIRLLVHGPYDAICSDDFLMKLLTTATDQHFKAFMRMDKESFVQLHDVIKDDTVFILKGYKLQHPPWYQLVIFLLQFGCDPALKMAEEASIAEGTPDAECRASIKAETVEFGFPGCIGIVDGSLIPLANKPHVNRELYWCCKKFYSVTLQAICDHNSHFIDYELGWPGSIHDTMVFHKSDVWLNKSKYFEDDDYILTDKGYPLTKFTIHLVKFKGSMSSLGSGCIIVGVYGRLG
ncbi:hypothetical protein M0805_006285 [Coniferiporia weirii]|nr:hypothetical protein M0805_006285 [Coniferiporia weirii]